MTKLYPFIGRILLKKVKQEENKTASGLILPDSTPKQERYEVVQGLDLDKGDIVYIDKYKAFEVTFESEKYYIVTEADILAYEDE